MALKDYRRKRDFRRTPEPQGKPARAHGQSFVIQKHAARQLHYDFRLELDGTLKSWAVPKGPSLDPAVKALAVQVEDHPLEYATFEGVIPQGQYGGGTVMVWDHGTWEPEGEANAREQFREGKLKFQLHGEKLHGSWALVRMGGSAGEGGKNWLLIKHNDAFADRKTDILNDEPDSVVSGRAMNAIAADADRIWHSDRDAATTNGKKKKSRARDVKAQGKSPTKVKSVAAPQAAPSKLLAALPGAQRAALPKALRPELATLVARVPAGDDWIHELKFDGYRLLTFIDHGHVRLVTRNGNDWTRRFAKVAAAVRKLPLQSAVLDGEIVSLDPQGRSNFQQLQNLMRSGSNRSLAYYVFDLPYLDGFDLARTPLLQRKDALAALLQASGAEPAGTLRLSDHIQGHGQEVLAEACRAGMEGIISKRADSTYQQARSQSWVKIKCLKRQEFVIGGYTRPSGSRAGFGALLLGYYDAGRLVYAGRVGTGFTSDTLRQMLAELTKRKAETTPFSNPPRGAAVRGVTWVQPELVAEVEFSQWTDDGVLRHPSFQGLREDKDPRQIVREVALPTAAPAEASRDHSPRARAGRVKKTARRAAAADSRTDRSKSGRPSAADNLIAGVRISNPDRVLYAEHDITKQQLAEYYESIADWILPYLVNRPLTLVRCPKGTGGHCFYQKHMTSSLPDTLRGVAIKEKDEAAEYVVLDDLSGLISLVQMSVLEIHPWQAPADAVESPDQMIFDLDPGPGVGWEQLVAAAREIRRQIEKHALQSFVRTSGGKGVHVVVPLKPGSTWDNIKSFARELAEQLAREQPDAYVATASKSQRRGKIYIDYLRNSRGATAVASYSTRAREGAPVALPLRWEELGKLTAANQFTVRNVPRRLGALKRDPWEGFFTVRQTL
ncbi:MAG: DNA ligase D [Pirellulales bacterium]